MKHASSTIVTSIVTAFAILAAASAADAADEIVVAAQETTAVVTPREPHLELVNLPALEFGLRAAYKCKGEPVSVTLSVADTHETLRGTDLANGRAVEITLTVPPRQLALAASSPFCVADAPETSNELLVPGLATAHASLRCAGSQGDSVLFASAPLQVRLVCARQPDESQVPSGASDDR
jgi:hypothetical protein